MSTNLSSTAKKFEQKKPRIMEVVGPAGVGKSTLCQILNLQGEIFHLGDFPDVRKITDAPFFIENGLRLAPIFLSPARTIDRNLTRREFAWLSILNGWPTILKKELEKTKEIIILDQGPIYLMAELTEFGPIYIKNEKAEALWQAWYQKWSETLDMIIWLDAADEFLIERIYNRDKEHIMKGESFPTIRDFLGKYRKGYERIIYNLKANSNILKVRKYDTSQQSPDEIAKHLIAEFS